MPFQNWTEELFNLRSSIVPLPTVCIKKKTSKSSVPEKQIFCPRWICPPFRKSLEIPKWAISYKQPWPKYYKKKKKACFILLILQMRKKHNCYELTWKGLCMAGRWRTHWHTALLQSSCRGEAASLELEQFKRKPKQVRSEHKLFNITVQFNLNRFVSSKSSADMKLTS